METNFDLSPELEEQYRNHKVVAIPNKSRGRSSVREVATANNNSPFQKTPQRPRSLSAGRSRNRPTDLVQDLYDRMGVNVRKGQAMDLNDNRKSAASISPTSTMRNSPSDIETSFSFQERYRNAVAGNNRVGGSFDNNNHASSEPKAPGSGPRRSRSRSLTRGSIQVSKRWPPPQDEPELAALQPLELGSPKRLSAVSSPEKRPISKRSSKRPEPLEPESSWLDNTSNTVLYGEEKKEDTPSIQERASAFVKPQNKSQSRQSNGLRKSIDSSYAAQFIGRDHPPKIDIFEGKKPVRDDSDTRSSPFVVIQPAHGRVAPVSPPLKRAATEEGLKKPIATRDYPPKIDIYEGKKPIREDSEVGASSLPFSQAATATAATTSTTVPRSPAEERKQKLTSPRPIPSPQSNLVVGGSQTGARTTKGASLATAFLSAIQSNNKSPPIASSNSHRSLPVGNSGAPLTEIDVALDSHDLVGADGSVAGLSTVSGEDFSSAQPPFPSRGSEVKKGAWSERNRLPFYQRAATAASVPLIPKQGNSNTNANNQHSAAATSSDIEKLVEERVQEKVADLESRIEQKLRTLVGQMEEKIMNRLDVLETKMTSAVTKKK